MTSIHECIDGWSNSVLHPRLVFQTCPNSKRHLPKPEHPDASCTGKHLTGVVGGELITPSPPSFHLRFGVQCLHRFGVRMPTAANCVVANANSLFCWKLGTEAAVGDGGCASVGSPHKNHPHFALPQ
eukprot:Gb_17338 [translate_table: standard]